MKERDWVEVRVEPFHRHSFENGFARLYDVSIPAGETSLYHRHTEDTLYVIVSPITVCEQTWGDEPSDEASVPAGVSFCRPHRSEPLIHRVTNGGAGEARMIGAEIKQSPPVTSQDPLAAPGHSLAWEGERMRAYRLDLEPGAGTDPIEYGFSGVTVALTRASLAIREAGGPERVVTREPGAVVWREPQTVSIRNVGETPYAAIVAEWR